jgi:hypothetical protein
MPKLISLLFLASLVGSFAAPFHNGIIIETDGFKLLDANKNTQHNNLKISDLENKITHSSDIECGLCVWVSGIVENYLSKNETETKIENSIDKLCSALPGKYGDLCKNVVEPRIPDLIQLIEQKESPDVICSQLKLCDSKFMNEVSEFDECFFNMVFAMHNTPYTLKTNDRTNFLSFINNHC